MTHGTLRERSERENFCVLKTSPRCALVHNTAFPVSKYFNTRIKFCEKSKKVSKSEAHLKK